ncbi:DeoR/GlpR family DNA-binding transcription regulator [Aerococcus sanguinicola]|uniref:DeoR/GlpR family DNA-binding transcription regulator n=1 Tax=Aerococcus sanguinicola TaxID=119206 RepID=UPI0018A7AA84|nr:DeoR/GlpR family DNA-binding transcription regulator [Aerococcus sanguinicola]
MYQEQRLAEMMRLLESRKQLSNQEMMAYFDVSRDTIRRDFTKLEDQGLVRRTHGGIVPRQSQPTIPGFNDRLQAFSQVKAAIAQEAAAFLEEGQLCFFDVSTLVLQLAQQLETGVTVYTHSLDNAIMLSGEEPYELHLLGGQFFPKNRFYYGLDTAQVLAKIHFDLAFIGAAGLQAGEVTYDDAEDAYLKEIILKQAKTKILLAEASKCQRTAPYSAGSIDQFDYLITDQAPDLPKDAQVQVIISQ